MDERQFKDLPLWLRLPCIFVLTLAIAAVCVHGYIELQWRCEARPIIVKGATDQNAPPWERI